MMSSTILSIQALACVRQQVSVLQGVTFSVREQELICLLGPRASGKTTLLHAIAGLVPVSAGEIILLGQQVSAVATHVAPEARSIGLIFQDYALFPHLNAAENLAFACQDPTASESIAAVTDMLAQLGVAELATRYPRELSAEQQLRIALGRALLCQPRILLLDVPFPALDSQRRDQLIAEIRDVLKQRQIAAILATASREEAFAWSDHVVLLNEGNVVQQGNPYELYYRPAHRFVADFLGKANYLPATILSEHQWQSIMGDHHANYPLNFPVGTVCDWLVRPQEIALALDAEGVAVVEDRLFMGSSNYYRVRLPNITITVQTSNWFEPGQQVRLSIKTDQPILFAPLTHETSDDERAPSA